MKKIFKNFIILFIFCLTFTFCGLLNFDFSHADTSGDSVKYINNANELVSYINSYGAIGHGKPTDHIVLTDNIDMSQYSDNSSGIATMRQYVLTKTIGTAENPFAGTFDGNGYKISNLKIDVKADMTESNSVVSDKQYAGLFGYTNGAVIKNVAFSGTSEIVAGGYKTVGTEKVDSFATNNIFAGLLIGRAENTKISMIQNLATLKFNPSFNSNVFFGSLVGSAIDSEISYVTSNNNLSFGAWNFDRTDGKIHNIGGLAGELSNVKTTFVTLTKKFVLDISSNFVGNLNLGGIAGIVSQGNSEIKNVAIENSYDIENNSLISTETAVNIGEIVGRISIPSPRAGNISYIHYKNNNLSKFGEMGQYEHKVELVEVSGHITASNFSLNALETSSGVPKYFSDQIWDDFDEWDFENVWYVGGQSIKLQNFYGDFLITYANNSTVFDMVTQDFETSYRYGSKVEMEFVYKTENEMSLSEFYNLTSINLYSKDITNSDLIKVITTENGFKLVINKVTLATQGEYSISTTPKYFKASVISKLFDEEGNEEGGIPGYVYYAEGANTTTEELNLGQMTYGQTYRLRTREKPSSPNLFVGWYLIDENGNLGQEAISTSKTLEVNVGQNPFVGDLKICAKYLDNAQVVNFILDSGISKIELNSTEIIDQSGQSTAVSKSDSNFKMDIFVNDGFEFNVDDFVKTLNTYKSVSSDEQFCVLTSQDQEENKYSFILNMTVLNKDDFGETFEIKAQTTESEKTNNTWIWIVVGVGGGLVLVGLVILIVWLVRRNRYGGGMGGGSLKSYKKGMYY